MVDKGRITDQQLRERMLTDAERCRAAKPTGSLSQNSRSASIPRAHSAASPVDIADPGENGRIRSTARPLEREALLLMEDVANYPDDGVLVRYRRLGFSGDKGHRLKSSLLNGGWLEQQHVRIGNTRKAIVRPTPVAREILGFAERVGGEGSIAHEYWRRWYANTFAEAGYKVQIEAPRIETATNQ